MEHFSKKIIDIWNPKFL